MAELVTYTLRRYRQRRRMGLRALEQLSGLSRSHLSDMELNRVEPRPSELARIAKALGCDPEDLFRFRGRKRRCACSKEKRHAPATP